MPFLLKEVTNKKKTWISSYLPTQEELENLCFIAVDPDTQDMNVCLCHVEAIVLFLHEVCLCM